MHLFWICDVKLRAQELCTRLNRDKTAKRRRGLLLDTPPGVRTTPGQGEAVSRCRDAKHRGVPFSRPPVWSKGSLTPPRAGRANLPDDIWRMVIDELSAETGDLLALRSTSRHFARLVDADRAEIFAKKVVSGLLSGTLASLTGQHRHHLFASLRTLHWQVDGPKDQARLAVVLPQLVGLRVLKLSGTEDWRLQLPTSWPPNLNALALETFDCAVLPAWSNQLPANLRLLLCTNGEVQVAGPATFPTSLRGLVLRDCGLEDAIPLDVSNLVHLRGIDLTHNFLHDGHNLKLPPHFSRTDLAKLVSGQWSFVMPVDAHDRDLSTVILEAPRRASLGSGAD